MKSARIFHTLICLTTTLIFTSIPTVAQEKDAPEDTTGVTSSILSGLKFRSVGPAFASGRIADIAIHPEDDNVWYVAVGSGGVWKTENAGVTWKPLFDDQSSYSIGCLTIDPSNPHVIWVGTGENVGGRHVGYGDGVYRSADGGKSWKHLGLKKSEHISKIIVHPENSDIVWVAAQGPLWSKGGERGVYKTVNGGKDWKHILGDSAWTGATDLAMDPRNPDRLYAATWQRHRTVAAYMGGGPGSGLHRSTDGGETWEKLSQGLPKSNLGKIGLAISPQDPDVLYAAIELDRRKGAVYRSDNRGASWEKRSETVSGATGPHYYQELYASPHAFDKLYLMDVRIQYSEDGGKTFQRHPERGKHSDNHAIAFRQDDPDYLLVGSDGGLYESFDNGAHWRFINNMPLTQYYKVAVNDQEPFYHIFGGTQDNGSHGGPSRTINSVGIRNCDWYKTLGADGHQSATEPGNPDILYAEMQQGRLWRVDLKTGEQVFIQPQRRAGEEGIERYNWDSPILVSPHDPTRIYFASQRVWRSDNRGESWTPVSGDLTRNQERLALPIMGKQQSWDNPWDVLAMSNYNTITSLAESPLEEGVLYAGTDDGIVQVTEDGGASWRKIEVGAIDGIPETAFVNDIKADLFDANTVYVALDNHKYGDFNPYLVKSADRGRTWTSITGDLPERTLVWRLVQDHVKPNLLFTATEFGIYCSLDGGSKWIELKAGVPTISFRDLVIQRQEDDLVCASFGRSFYVLDDYSPLREISEDILDSTLLFQPRDAELFVPRNVVSSQGAFEFAADNPPFGAILTYYLPESLKTLEAHRKAREKKLEKEGQDIPFPGWDSLEMEKLQEKPAVYLQIYNHEGNVVQRVDGSTSKGVHRVAWNLRHASNRAISVDGRHGSGSRGYMVAPGTFSAALFNQEDGQVTQLAGPVTFDVVPLFEGTLEGADPAEIIAYREDLEKVETEAAAVDYLLENSMNKVKAMQAALERADDQSATLMERIHDVRSELNALHSRMEGNVARDEIGENDPPSVSTRMYVARQGLGTTYGPTGLHRENLDIARSDLESLMPQLTRIAQEVIPQLEEALEQAGAPWIEGMTLPKNK